MVVNSVWPHFYKIAAINSYAVMCENIGMNSTHFELRIKNITQQIIISRLNFALLQRPVLYLLIVKP